MQAVLFGVACPFEVLSREARVSAEQHYLQVNDRFMQHLYDRTELLDLEGAAGN